MESRPPQEPPRRTAAGRKPNGTGGAATAPWLWLLLIAAFALIFWHLKPNNEIPVDYQPWFMEQAKSGNLKNLMVQGSEVHGKLRKKKNSQPQGSTTLLPVKKFSTNFPSGESARPI